MDDNIFINQRKSYIETGKIYFWTATVNKWQRLFENDTYKEVIISSFEYLTGKDIIDVFAFVIMPNHIHVIWRINKNNGKETGQASFLKFTAHEFKKMLKKDDEGKLSDYAVQANNKSYEFWQRDSLAVPLYSQKIAYQKLNYIHLNPLAEHWNLVNDPCNYKYSSARFYEMGIQQFSFIKDLRNEF